MTSRSFRRLLAFVLCFALLPALAAPQGNSQGKGNGKAKGHGKPDAAANDEDRDEPRPAGAPVFSTRDRDRIKQYFTSPYSSLPPGLAKRGSDLPPGLQKQLAKNGKLPPGLEKRVQPFPPQLETRLPKLPPTYERGVIGSDVIILNRKTQMIVDIMRDVLMPPHASF